MINPSELRIGNKILFAGYDILPDGGRVGDPDGDFEIDVDVDVIKNAIKSPSDYKPIPLTPQWLERCGFVESNNIFKSGVFESSEMGYEVRYDAGIYTFCYYDVQLKDITYFHQLQNLYYTLTGEELTIKSN